MTICCCCGQLGGYHYASCTRPIDGSNHPHLTILPYELEEDNDA